MTYVHRGRVEEDVIAYIRKGGRGAIVGVHAPGGLGKTELAKKIAETLQDEFEILWVDVGEKKPQQVVGELLTKCGVQMQPADSYERLINELHHAYQEHHLLVVLDDVRQPALERLPDLLPPAPCAALATSRIQQMGGLKTFPLGSMTWDQAHELFKAILGDDVAAAEIETLKTLAERCKFNPLAMEIAARRIRQFEGIRKPVERYFEIAQARFSELRMDGDARWDMEKIFDISYQDLNEDDRARFLTLSSFHASGFSIDALAFLWKDEPSDARRVLMRLINLSLVIPVEIPGNDHERYRLHDLLDEYATPKLKASGRYNETKESLAQWLTELFEANYLPGVENFPMVLPERDNLLYICEWARGEKQADILALLTTKARNWFYINFTDAWAYWSAWLKACLQLGISDDGLKANVREAIGDVQQFRDDRDAALESYNEALKLYQAVGDRLGEANVLQAIGDVQQFRKETDAALESYNEALKLYQAVGAKLGEANVLMSLGDFNVAQEKWHDAITYYEQALPIYEIIHAQLGQANMLIDLGKAYFEIDDHEKGMGCVKEAGDIFARIGNTYWAIISYRRLADMLKKCDRAEEAKQIESQLDEIEKRS